MTVQSQPRRHSTCHRHPTTPVTGFCATCLRERLAAIEASAAAASSAGDASELRRSKSCSGGPRSDDVAPDSQRRRSCDVKVRTGDGAGGAGGNNSLWSLFNLDDERKGAPGKLEVELGNLGFELKEEDRIRANAEDEEAELKTMKEFIDLEWTKKKKSGTGRDLKDIAGTFWEAASGLSKKLTKWRRKPKEKRLPAGVLISGDDDGRRPRETQSEVGEYGFGGGRRSCDTDPRFSVDVAARMSLDECRRCSFDEPRASWDGYFSGRAPRMVAPLVSLVEDGKLSDSDNGGETGPGGTEQTKDYYSESASRRRRSFDCANSAAAARRGETDELKLISNAKVSPATSELFYGAKLLITDKDLREAKLKAVNADEPLAVEPPSSQKGSKKAAAAAAPWQRVLSIWGPKARPRRAEEGLILGPNPGADSWKKGGSVRQCQKLIRSYSVSCQNESKSRGNVVKSREEFVVQRSRNGRFSPGNADNGLLRFYLTPLRSYKRTQSQPHKTRLNTPTISNNVL